jgi:hypothetical protein
MDTKPRKSFRKQMLHTIAKPFKSKSRGQSQERPIPGQHQDTLGVNQPDRAASAPPDISQELTEQVHVVAMTSADLSQSAQSLTLGDSTIDPLLNTTPSVQTATTVQSSEPSVASVTPAPISNVGKMKVSMPSSSKPSAAMQTAKFVGKSLLGLLSSAAEGIPVPGVKGIFDTILKVVNIVEVSYYEWLLTNTCLSHSSRRHRPIKWHSKTLKFA